jgi:uncharacterized protein YdaU (DUF1376 family)
MTSASPTTWMPIYWGDFLKDTMHLSTEEKGAYLLLIAHYWSTGRAVKNDKILIKNVCGLSPKKLQNVLAFFTEKDGFLYHARIDEELRKAIENKDMQRKRTESATAARRLNKADVTTNVTLDVTLSPSPSPSPLREESKGERARESLAPPPDILVKEKKPKPEPAWPDSDPDNVDAYERCGNGFKLKANWCCPNEWFAWVRGEFGWDETKTLLESEKFRDYWRSPDAKKPIKADWFTTWKNWCRTTNGVRNYGN